MANEIDRIATTTEFNGIKMLNSATGTTSIHFGVGSTLSVEHDRYHQGGSWP